MYSVVVAVYTFGGEIMINRIFDLPYPSRSQLWSLPGEAKFSVSNIDVKPHKDVDAPNNDNRRPKDVTKWNLRLHQSCKLDSSPDAPTHWKLQN